MTDGSVVLQDAVAHLGSRAYFKQVSIVIPAHWDESHCQVNVMEPVRGVAYQVNYLIFNNRSSINQDRIQYPVSPRTKKLP